MYLVPLIVFASPSGRGDLILSLYRDLGDDHFIELLMYLVPLIVFASPSGRGDLILSL